MHLAIPQVVEHCPEVFGVTVNKEPLVSHREMRGERRTGRERERERERERGDEQRNEKRGG